MRRPSDPELVLSVAGALCAVALVALWPIRDARAVDATPAPLGLTQVSGADERDAGAQGERAALESSDGPLINERRALAASDPRALLALHPDRSQLDFEVSAGGTSAAGAVILLFAPSEVEPPFFIAPPGLTLAENGGVVTDRDGRANVAVAPKVEWRGVVRWTPLDPAPPLSAEFRAVSPIAGYPRTIAIDLASMQASRFLHIEVCSAPSGLKLGGAELFAIMDDGSPAPPELGPTHVVSGADGGALMWWPLGARLRVEAAGHTPLELPSTHLDRIRAGVVSTSLEAAAAAPPTALELAALGALHGRLDPSWAAGGRVFVGGPTVSTLGPSRGRGGAAHGSYDRERTAAVTSTGHWRIDGLPTYLLPDPTRAFAAVPRGELLVRFTGADVHDVPRVVRATLHVDVGLDAGQELELPDPFGVAAPVVLTAVGTADLGLDGARVELHLLRSAGGEEVVPVALPRARITLSKGARVAAASRLVAEGHVTATGRVLAPDLPLGRYELRVPRSGASAGRPDRVEVTEEPLVGDGGIYRLDTAARSFRGWGRFEHDGRPVEVQLTSEQPQDDD